MSVITGPQRRIHTGFRIPEQSLARIDQLAKEHQMTRTDYVIRAATGELEDPADIQAALTAITKRLDWLEQLAING